MSRKDISDLLVCIAFQETKAARASGLTLHPYDLLGKWTGEPYKVCYRAMERADDKGLIEHGVSMRTGWLTEKGLELLEMEER